MPRPKAPPTPASSTDIRGKEGSNVNSNSSFNLPPTAYNDPTDRASPATSSVSSAHASDSSYHPYSPTSPQHQLSRKRTVSQAEDGGVKSGSGIITRNDFSLPPPPTRSRKIIQMKPAVQAQPTDSSVQSGPATPSQATISKQTPANSKKKQSNGQTTAAGRKIARKTAHSLIERRRRSKMNEEFGVLKDMIPACKGQEMHKLAILQAAIEYMRYLERCVDDLKTVQQQKLPAPEGCVPPPPGGTSSSQQQIPSHEARSQEQEVVAIGEDEEMSEPSLDDSQEARDEADEVIDEEGDTAATPPLSTTPHLSKSGSLVSLPSLSHITSTLSTTSASIYSSANAGGYNSSVSARHPSISSAATYSPSFSPYLHSTQTSPAFGGQQAAFTASGQPFSLSSPALRPIDSSSCSTPSASETQYRFFASNPQQQQDAGGSRVSIQKPGPQKSDLPPNQNDILDQEASAALLMLNSDRRNWKAPPSQANMKGTLNTGMSVRDLLSG